MPRAAVSPTVVWEQITKAECLYIFACSSGRYLKAVRGGNPEGKMSRDKKNGAPNKNSLVVYPQEFTCG